MKHEFAEPGFARRALAIFLSNAMLWGAAPIAWAGPEGEQVVNGDVSFSRQGDLTQIHASDGSIINYSSFDIRSQETVQFIQPDERSSVLNKIRDAAPTQIDGTLLANGRVYFVNPAGVYFGPSAVVDVGALFAAAGSMSDEDFLARRDRFSDLQGRVVNLGSIEGDIVALVGREVANRGQITSHGGLIALVAGDEVVLVPLGEHVRVRLAANAAPVAVSDLPGVENTGGLDAGAGEVNLAAGDLYSLAIRQSETGSIAAHDVAIEGGEGGLVHISGSIDASDRSPGATGGSVSILGDRVALTDAVVDASGDAGGGSVLVGGDFQGANPDVRNARRTFVSADTQIKADALAQGDGGKVIVWSDEATRFDGSLSARGGANGGDGGFAEVSGKQALGFDGSVTLSADAGTSGTLLLDPKTFTVQAASPDIAGDGTNLDIAALTDLDDALLDFPGKDSIITAGAVDALLAGTSTLILAATDSGTINAAITGSGDANLTLDAPTLNLNEKISLAGAGVLSGGATTLAVNVGSNGSIQNGVDVAAAGGTVAVAVGDFNENVAVAKTLALEGAQSGIDPGTALITTVDSATQSVIHGQVQLTAPNTTFDGFTVTGSTAGAGVVASNAQGDQIKNNFITDNVFGLSLASDGSSTLRVEHNYFKDNNRAGSASGNGIYTDFTVSNVLVDANKFSEHLSGSVSFYGSAVNPQSNVSISGNTIDHDGPIGLATINDVTISGNTINRNGFDSLDALDPAASGDAIWIGGGVGDVGIGGNLITDNAGAGLKFTKISSSVDPNPSANFTVSGNSFSGNLDGAIFINTSEGSRYTGILNASGNWWGSASGPAVARAGFAGSGQVIDNAEATGAPNDDLVDFTPWLDTGVPAMVGTPGFIGNFSALHVTPLSPQFGYNASDDSTGRIAEALGLLTGANRTLHLWGGTYDDQDSISIPGGTDPVAVILNGNVSLDSKNDLGDISFGSTVDSSADAMDVSEFHTLAVFTGGVTTFGDGSGNDGVGGTNALGSLYTDDDGAAANGLTGERTVFDIANAGTDVATSQNTAAGASGNQTYNDAVVLEQDTVLAAINGDPTSGYGAITFNATVDSAADGMAVSEFNGLTVNTGGVTTFGNGTGDDRVGAVNALGSLTSDFDGSFPAGPTGERTVFDIANATTDVATAQNAAAGASGSQTYNDAVVLEQDTVLAAINGNPTTGDGSITFNASVDSAAAEFNDLTINTGGVTTFGDGSGDDRVGNVDRLGSLTTDLDGSFPAGPTGERTVFNIASTNTVSTAQDAAAAATGSQIYNDAVVLELDTILSALNGDPLTGDGAITFNATLDSAPGVDSYLTVATAGITTFAGDVGSSDTTGGATDTGLGQLTVNGGGFTQIGAIGAGAGTRNVRTIGTADALPSSGNQIYTDAVVLNQDTVVTSAGSTGTRSVNFQSTVDAATAGGQSLAVDTDGATTFGGNVGTGVTLASVTTNDGGTTGIAADVSTTGAQTYNDNVTITGARTLTAGGAGVTFGNGAPNSDTLAVNGATTIAGPLTLNAATTLAANLTVNAGAGPIDLNGTINDDGAGGTTSDLALNTTGATTIDGVIGTTPLTSVTTNDGGTTGIAADVSTTGAQTYNDNVTITGTRTLTAGGAGVTFGNGAPNSDTLAVNGATTIAGPLTLNAATTLAANLTVNAGAGPIDLNGTINDDGAGGTTSDLALNTTGATTIDGVIGTTPLTSVTTNDGGTTGIAADVSTTGAQTYNDNVTITGARTLTAGGAGVTFGNGAPNSDTLAVNGATTIAGPLTLNAATTLAANLTVNAGAGPIDLNGTINDDGAGGTTSDLALNTTGATTIDGVIGGGAVGNRLTSVTTNDGGTTGIAADVSTTGAQTYNDNVTITGARTLTAGGAGVTFGNGAPNSDTLAVNGATTIAGPLTLNAATTLAANLTVNAGAGPIDLNGTINDDGAGGTTSDLALNTTGATTIDGVIGTTPLTSVTTNDGGTTGIAADVSTTGTQTYNDNVTITGTRTLTAGGAGVTFGNGAPNSDTLAVNGATTIAGPLTLNAATTLAANLTVNAGAGPIDLNGTINDDGAGGTTSDLALNTTGATTIDGVIGTTPLTSVTTNASGTTTISGGSITTTGNQAYNDAVVLGNDLTIQTTNNGSLSFASTIDGTTAGNEALDIITATTTGTPVFFGDDIGAATRLEAFRVNVGNQRMSTPLNATILFQKAGNLSVNANTITIAKNEKITADLGGNTFTLNAPNPLAVAGPALTVTDLNAERIALTAGTGGILVAGRAGAPSSNSNGLPDSGADWVGNSFTITSPTLAVDGGDGQTVVRIGTQNGSSSDVTLSGGATLATFLVQAAFNPVGTAVTTSDLVVTAVGQDLTPGGLANGSQRAPNNPLPIDLQRPSNSGNREAISQKPLRDSEVAAFLACDTEDLDCQAEAIGSDRANSAEAQDLRESYDALFGTPGSAEAAKAIDEKPQRAALQKAVDGYRSATNAEPSGVAFRQFCQSSPEYAPALKVLDDLRDLFTTARQFGMSGEGIGNFKQVTLQEVAPTGITIDALDAAVEAGALDQSSAGLRLEDAAAPGRG